jgi:hypothetical protein
MEISRSSQRFTPPQGLHSHHIASRPREDEQLHTRLQKNLMILGSVPGGAVMTALSQPGWFLDSLSAVRLLTNHSTEAWREHSRYATTSMQGRAKDDAL